MVIMGEVSMYNIHTTVKKIRERNEYSKQKMKSVREGRYIFLRFLGKLEIAERLVCCSSIDRSIGFSLSENEGRMVWM